MIRVMHRGSVALAAGIALGLAIGACGSKDGSTPGPSPRGAEVNRPSTDAATASGDDARGAPGGLDAAAAPPGLPNGAVGQIGAPRLSSADAIQRIVAVDGRILTCGDRHIRLWDISGTLLWSRVATAGSAECALSPGGRFIGVAQGDHPIDVRVVDWRAGTEVRSTANQRVYGFAFTADDARVAVLGGRVNLRPADRDGALATTAELIAIGAFDAHGTLVGVGGDRVVTWSGAAGDEAALVATLPARSTAAAFSADAGRVAVVTSSGVSLVDVAARAVTALPLDAAVKPTQVALSPKGDLVAVGTKTSVSVWDVATGTPRWTRPTKTWPAPAFSRDGARLYYADVATVIDADARSGEAAPRAPRPSFVAWTTDNEAVVSTAGTRSAITPTGGKVEPFAAPTASPDAPAWVTEEYGGADGLVVGVAADQLADCGPLKIWVKGQREQTLPRPTGCDPDATTPTWQVSPGVVVAAGGVRPGVWDVVAKRQVMTLERGVRPLIASAASRDRKVLVVVLGPAAAADDAPDAYADVESRSGTVVETYALPDGTQLGRARFDREGVTAAAISADGQRAFLGWDDGQLDALAPAAVADLQQLGKHTSAIDAFALSPDGALLAATDEDRVTIFWRVSPTP